MTQPNPTLTAALCALFLTVLPACADAGADAPQDGAMNRPATFVPAAAAPAPRGAPHPDSSRFAAAAEAAWAYVAAQASERTGLVDATASYENITTWDVGGVLGAYFSAYRLGLIDRAEYERRMGSTLATLEQLPLFDDGALNKVYSASGARPIGRNGAASSGGFGWSALDIGRVLIWLRIVAENDPQFAEQAGRVAKRMDYDRIVRGGYIWGEDRGGSGQIRRYQEGKIGYEQYAERGFRLWGHPADFAADYTTNAAAGQVFDIPLPVDQRGNHCLTSEPYYLMGIETGWDDASAELARRILDVQRQRWQREDIVTMASEDAMTEAPYYFYYYCVLGQHGPFTVDAQGTDAALDGPRWVSSKAAFAWHALLPDDYTALAVERVQPARTGRGWHSGVYEGSERPTGSINLNTAAVILEAALYARLGRPLMEAGPGPGS